MGHATFTFGVRVHPGSRRAHVGGAHDGDLVVRVRARAVDGAANAEVIEALAEALGLRRGDVSLVRPGRSRRKLVVVHDSATVRSRLQSLLLTPHDHDPAFDAEDGTSS